MIPKGWIVDELSNVGGCKSISILYDIGILYSTTSSAFVTTTFGIPEKNELK